MNNEWVFHRLADHQLFEDGYFFNLSDMDHEGPEITPPSSPVYVNSAEPQIITYPRYGDFLSATFSKWGVIQNHVDQILPDFFQGAHLVFFWFISMTTNFFQAAAL